MTNIYLIRHAEAEGNLYRRVQGHHDGKITTRGYTQIAALAERFRDVHIDAIYASDLSRTQETAGAILKYHDLPLNIDVRLKEVCMGVWENDCWGNVEKYYPEQYNCFSNDPDNWHVEDSESFSDLADRMVEGICDIASRHDGQTIVLVSHGMAIRSLHCRILGVASRDVKDIPHGDNTCVSNYEYRDGELINIFRNDNSHLDNKTSTFSRQTWWKQNTGPDRNNLHFLPLDMSRSSSYYIDCYADAWKTVYGTLEGFDPNAYLMQARRHASENLLFSVISVDETIGILELDLTENHCHICLCYLEESRRGASLGAQLIGQADKVARDHNIPKLRLHVSTKNEKAIGFYSHYGFEIINKISGVATKLCVMEKVLQL